MTAFDSKDLLVRTRAALLDALEALAAQNSALIIIGAQAVYLHTGGVAVALAETTKDSDVALDPRRLHDQPLIQTAMKTAGFFPAASDQPGSWINQDGIPVDLMVPEQLSEPGGRRGGRIPPHSSKSTRKARGLEAVLVDNVQMEIVALGADDPRKIVANVAGGAALLVAKLHKIGERVSTPHRLNDKDAHDLYRLLSAIETDELVQSFEVLRCHEISSEVTDEALNFLSELFAAGPDALGSQMAGRAEEGVGNPDHVALATALLASDLLKNLR